MIYLQFSNGLLLSLEKISRLYNSTCSNCARPMVIQCILMSIKKIISKIIEKTQISEQSEPVTQQDISRLENSPKVEN